MGALGSSTGFFTYESTWDVAFPSMRERPDLADLALPDLLVSIEPGARSPGPGGLRDGKSLPIGRSK